MRDDFLPFSKPTITDTDITAVTEVMRSGWITTGQKAAEFEKRFCEYTGAAGAVALASATAGMHLVLAALNIGPGDEVITPSMTWVSTVNLIVLSGATPVFADIDKDTLMVTPETLEGCITGKTKLIIPVHFAGAPADMDPIRKMASERGLFVIEDAAHAVGTRYRNEKIGAIGTSIFSFHPIKNITTGEGGMFCTDDPELLDHIKRLKFHGLGVDAYDRKTQGRSPQAQVIEPGFKYNLTDMAAALGITQLDQIEVFNAKRRQLSAHYDKRFSEIDEILPLSAPGYDHLHARHLYIVRLDIDRAGMTRDDFMARLGKRNIGTGLHFRAVHTHRYYRENLPVRPGTLENTEWNSDRICSLPLFPQMTTEDVDEVVDAIKAVICR